MGSQSLKREHKSPKKKKNLFEFSNIFKKNIYELAPHPPPKVHNILIVGAKVLKSNHKSYTTVKPTQTYKYIQIRTLSKSKSKPKLESPKSKSKSKSKPQKKAKTKTNYKIKTKS